MLTKSMSLCQSQYSAVMARLILYPFDQTQNPPLDLRMQICTHLYVYNTYKLIAVHCIIQFLILSLHSRNTGDKQTTSQNNPSPPQKKNILFGFHYVGVLQLQKRSIIHFLLLILILLGKKGICRKSNSKLPCTSVQSDMRIRSLIWGNILRRSYL